MGAIAAGTFAYWGVVVGLLALIVISFNTDYDQVMKEESKFTSFFLSDHDGTPYGKAKQWLDTFLKNSRKRLFEISSNFPDVLSNVGDSSFDSLVHAFRGLSLASIYITVLLCDFIGIQMLQDILMADEADTIINLSIFVSILILLFIVELYAMAVFLQRRKQRQGQETFEENADNESVATGQIEDPKLGPVRKTQGTVARNNNATTGAGSPRSGMASPNPQDQGKSLELWNEGQDADNEAKASQDRTVDDHKQAQDALFEEGMGWEDADMDLKTMAMFAYITDCEAYEEDDLRRQNGELRRQIEEGREAFKDMDEQKREEMARLTKSLRKMLKQVRKESQFANYALDTLKTEKDVINEELARLLAMEPEELAQLESSELFRNLNNKVQKSASRAPKTYSQYESTRA